MKPITANDIAAKFAAKLAEALPASALDTIADRNALLGDDTRVCHSHDFCDANVYMQEALESVLGREFDMQSDEDGALWNEAFARFRFHGSRIGRTLAAHGLTLEHQGGGMFNWRRDLGKGLEVFCCGPDGQEPTDSEGATFGLTLAGSDVLAQNDWDSGAALAAALNSTEIV